MGLLSKMIEAAARFPDGGIVANRCSDCEFLRQQEERVRQAGWIDPVKEKLAKEFANAAGFARDESIMRGAKFDDGKNRLGLVLLGFARALQEVGLVGTYGANKYTDDGWTNVPDGERRYTDAMLRHLLREASGEQRDPESGQLHAAHAAWNALARLDLALRSKRKSAPTPPPTSESAYGGRGTK